MDDRIGMEILAELKKLNELLLGNAKEKNENQPIQFVKKRETRGRKAKGSGDITAKPRAYVRKKIQP